MFFFVFLVDPNNDAFEDGYSYWGSEKNILRGRGGGMEPEQQGVSWSPLQPHGTAAGILYCSMMSSAHILQFIFL